MRRRSLLRLDFQHACHAHLHHLFVLVTVDEGVEAVLLVMQALDEHRHVEITCRTLGSDRCVHHDLVADLQGHVLEHNTGEELELQDVRGHRTREADKSAKQNSLFLSDPSRWAVSN